MGVGYLTVVRSWLGQVCGLNYATEGPLAEPVFIKPDSEYPDWLWTIETKRPLPPLEERTDTDTREYWLHVQRDMKRRRNKLHSLQHKGRSKW